MARLAPWLIRPCPQCLPNSSDRISVQFCWMSSQFDVEPVVNDRVTVSIANLIMFADELTLSLPGIHLVCWGALTNFPCKLRLFFSLRPGGAGAPTAPPGYAYVHLCSTLFWTVVIWQSWRRPSANLPDGGPHGGERAPYRYRSERPIIDVKGSYRIERAPCRWRGP